MRCLSAGLTDNGTERAQQRQTTIAATVVAVVVVVVVAAAATVVFSTCLMVSLGSLLVAEPPDSIASHPTRCVLLSTRLWVVSATPATVVVLVWLVFLLEHFSPAQKRERESGGKDRHKSELEEKHNSRTKKRTDKKGVPVTALIAAMCWFRF